MKKIINICFFILALIIIKGCIDPIEIKGLGYEDFLMVEATLTDELKTQKVKLSRSFPLDSIESIKETNAIVAIKSNSNTYNFTETSDGVYTSDIQFKAEPNINYTLEIKTQNGKTWLSNSEKLTGLSTITEVTPKKETNNVNDEGIRIYIKGKGLDENAKYFRYEYEETFQVIPPYWSETKLEIVSDEYPFSVREVDNTANNRVCYSSQNSNTIIQKETASLINGTLDTDILFINKYDFAISHRYSILIKQYVQSFNAYNYFKTLNKLSTNLGSFSQSQPGFLLGNITSTENDNDKAIGYFEVVTVATKRMFLNRDDFFPRDPVDFIKECDIIAPKLLVVPRLGIDFARSPLISALKFDWVLYKSNPDTTDPVLVGPYLLVKKECGDCRETGTNVKPNFWID